MTKHEKPTQPDRRFGVNAPQPVCTLRDWLDHLEARGRLKVLKPGVGLRFDVAAIAKRAADHGFAFASVVGAFTGHEICSGSAWLHSLNWTNIGESYHPTAAGHSGGYLPVFTNAA